MTRRAWTLVAGAVLLVSLLAGCGQQNGTTSASATSTARPWTTPSLIVAGKPGNVARAEWGPPAGAFTGKPAKAVIMIIHGGGWAGNDPTQFRASQIVARGFRNLGFATVAVDYRAGPTGVEDVDRIYAATRRRAGPRMPICAAGGSAGGHIALMLAVRHSDLACVIADGAPTDLTAFPKTNAVAGSRGVARFAGVLAKYSPARHASSIRAKLLLVYAQNDPVVPVAQGYAMKKADPAATLIVLPPGPVHFVHSSVTAPAKAQAQAQEVEFLERASRRR